MIEIFEKRGSWCYRNAEGRLLKFATEAEAKSSLGYLEPEKDNGSEKEKDQEESSAEETSAPSFGVSEENSESESEEE
jgi:hypothetical protein